MAERKMRLRPGRPRRVRRAGPYRMVLAAALIPFLVGCANLQQPDVEQVATAFSRPGADPAARCALLAPATVIALEHDESSGCAQALDQLAPPGGGPVQSTAVWGDNAQVRLTDDTLFLNRTEQGWKITAAGCRSQGDAPYLCRLEA